MGFSPAQLDMSARLYAEYDAPQRSQPVTLNDVIR
jgi:hypothetical protein